MIETMTHEVTTGRKNAVRKTSRPRNCSFIMKRDQQREHRLADHREQGEVGGVAKGVSELAVLRQANKIAQIR